MLIRKILMIVMRLLNKLRVLSHCRTVWYLLEHNWTVLNRHLRAVMIGAEWAINKWLAGLTDRESGMAWCYCIWNYCLLSWGRRSRNRSMINDLGRRTRLPNNHSWIRWRNNLRVILVKWWSLSDYIPFHWLWSWHWPLIYYRRREYNPWVIRPGHYSWAFWRNYPNWHGSRIVVQKILHRSSNCSVNFILVLIVLIGLFINFIHSPWALPRSFRARDILIWVVFASVFFLYSLAHIKYSFH